MERSVRSSGSSFAARTVRILTAVVLISACGSVIAHGWSIARFAFVYTSLDDSEDPHRPLEPWQNSPGLSFIEREAALTQVGTWDDHEKTQARREELGALLAVKPLSSGYWLSLARMRFATGQPVEDVARALEMSVLTGPNEGNLMWQRAAFDFQFWNVLPPNVRARAAAELLDDSLSNEQAASLRSLLAEKSAKERQEIRELLRSSGVSDRLATTLGL
jgi:hypothetical protein